MNRRGEQPDSPRAQHYAIRRHCTIGGDADAPSSVEVIIGIILRHGICADAPGHGLGHSRARAMRADYVLSAAANTSPQASISPQSR